MRITIETDANGVASITHAGTADAVSADTDGGAAGDASGTSGTDDPGAAEDQGGPPEWLAAAIDEERRRDEGGDRGQSADRASTAADADAGPGPAL